jgi:hypothetical protein
MTAFAITIGIILALLGLGYIGYRMFVAFMCIKGH